MRWSREGKWILAAFGSVLLLMGTVSLVSYKNAMQLVESADRVKKTNEILDVLTDISAALADAESRRWGYILFDDQNELEQYNRAIQRLTPLIDQLRYPLSDTPIQQQRLNRLEALIAERIVLFQTSSELYQQEPIAFSSEDPLITEIKRNQTRIQRVINAMETEEQELLEVHLGQAQSNLQFRLLIEPLGALLTFGILFFAFALLFRQMLKRQQAETLQRSLAQQKELSELKLQFFSMVSHEFRTPLSLILGSAQLLHETLKPLMDGSRLKNLDRIQASAKMMTQLLNDVLTLSRADAGKLEYSPQSVEIQTFCLNLVEDFQTAIGTSQSIRFSQKGHCTHAIVDEKLLYSILSNLLSNAIKYSPSHSAIEFTLIREVDAITFQVRDEGIGIPEEDQVRLYDLFSRGGNVREVRGTGLGLAVAKKCLDLHHGAIVVDSEVGAGTTFTVRIPQ